MRPIMFCLLGALLVAVGTSKQRGFSVFIAMPTVNDPMCAETIRSAFNQAAYPTRIFFGVHQQTDTDRYGDCVDTVLWGCKDDPAQAVCNHVKNIRISRVPPNEAAGPTHGRVMADKHYQGEDYYFVTDSHSFFVQHWDTLIIDHHRSLPLSGEFAILTHYPRGDDIMAAALKEKPTSSRRAATYHICGTEYERSENRIPRNANGCYARIKLDVPHVLTGFWAGGFAFSRGALLRTVRLDPNYKWLFHGEEFHFASRAWTHGYDLYTPPFDVIFHRYASADVPENKRRHSPPLPANHGHLKDLAEKRLNALWGLLDTRTPHVDRATRELVTRDLDQYGLGNKRTLDQFWQFLGIDPLEMTITVFPISKLESGGLTRVPWRSDDPMMTLEAHDP